MEVLRGCGGLQAELYLEFYTNVPHADDFLPHVPLPLVALWPSLLFSVSTP